MQKFLEAGAEERRREWRAHYGAADRDTHTPSLGTLRWEEVQVSQAASVEAGPGSTMLERRMLGKQKTQREEMSLMARAGH